MHRREKLVKREILGLCLDVGCGYRTLHQAIDGPNVYGIDIARELLKGMDRVVHGDAERLPFKDCAFDTVVAGDVVEHLPEPDLFISEAYRTLRQGGKLIVTTHNRNSWISRLTHHSDQWGHVSLMDGKELSLVGAYFSIKRFSYYYPDCAICYRLGAMDQYISIGYGRQNLLRILRLPLVRQMACWLEDHKFFLYMRRAAHLCLPPPLREEMLMICTKEE